MAISKDDEIYFTDIRGRSIVKVDVADKSTENLFEQTYALTINFTKPGNEFLDAIGKIKLNRKHKQFSDKIRLKIGKSLCLSYFITKI